MALARLIAPFKNATIGSALVFAASGAAFALANILLARGLEVEAYARFALAIAVYNVAALVAPLGMDQLSIRRSLTYTRTIVALQFAMSALVGLAFAFAAQAYVAMSLSATLALAAAITVGGVMVGATAEVRRRGSTFIALVTYILPNIGLLVIGAIAVGIEQAPLDGVLWSYALVTGIAALIALGLANRGEGIASGPSGYSFAEAMPLLGLAALGTLTLQMERLVLPAMIDLKSLATFSLLSSLAIFPFRLISSGMGFALTPQLSDREKIAANYTRVKVEMAALVALLAVGAAILVFLVPVLMPWLTEGRYQASHWLVLAACASGLVMVGQALARAIITALGSLSMLHVLNIAGWTGLALSIAAAWYASQYGLIGVILAVAASQALVTGPLLMMAWRSFGAQARSV